MFTFILKGDTQSDNIFDILYDFYTYIAESLINKLLYKFKYNGFNKLPSSNCTPGIILLFRTKALSVMCC